MATKKLSAKVAPATKTTTTRKPTPVMVKKASRQPVVSEAPHTLDPHAPKPDCVGKARKALAAAAQKQAAQSLTDDLATGRKAITPLTLEGLSSPQKQAIAKAKGWKGYSGLSSKELDAFLLNGGTKPAPTVGSTRDMREQVAQAKKDGLVSGPVSSLKVEELKKVYAKVAAGEKYEVKKAAPNEGTMGYNQALLRNADGKGYKAEYTAQCKKDFGCSISALKAEQLKALVKTLGLAK